MNVDEVMDRYARGDDGVFDTLYGLLSGRLYGFCARLCGSSGEADDLFQEAFLKIHRSRSSFVPGTSAMAWSFAIARSTYLDRVRSRARRPEKLSDRDDGDASMEGVGDLRASPEANVAAAVMARIVERELQKLSEENRSAYILLKFEGLSSAEAGAILGASGDAVKQRAHRVHETLRSALQRAGWEVGALV